MKVITRVVALALTLGAASSWAQIPVTDVALNSQTQANQAANFAKFVEQISEMKMQYDQMQRDYALANQQYASTTGSRGMGSVNYDRGITELITTADQLYQSNSRTEQIVNQEKLQGSEKSQREAIQARSMRAAASDKAAALQSFQAAQARLSQIESLMGRISGTPDAKAIQEVQARIAIEQSLLANEQARHQINASASQAEQRLIQEQRQAYKQNILKSENTGMPRIK